MTTDFDLTCTLSDQLDITTDAAGDALALFIPQMERIDGGTIDRDDLSASDVEFLTGTVKGWLESDPHIGELVDAVFTARQKLAEVTFELQQEEARDQPNQKTLTKLENKVFSATLERNKAIGRALAYGAVVAVTADAAGLSRDEVLAVADAR